MILEINNYSNEIIDSSSDLQWDTADATKPLKIWWNLFNEISLNLFDIFYKLSSVSLSISPVERSFSIQSLIKNNCRWKLLDSTVQHSVNIKFNSLLINKKDEYTNENIFEEHLVEILEMEWNVHLVKMISQEIQ